jgi:hypothetical protein
MIQQPKYTAVQGLCQVLPEKSGEPFSLRTFPKTTLDKIVALAYIIFDIMQ